MYLKYYLDSDCKRVYTMKNKGPNGEFCVTAHPARFSPEDKYSKHRIALKKRFGLFMS
ncbi:ribosome biogenesis protein nop10, putative [Theileria equi strain WA]|uniref:Nucleolar protein 10 n=1 Tax=Theileria equi strain WA TaxID=1537102 RepID=L1LEC1_THEEQ|nr:ribosome biogenesis protein nop10, putative [Theileria equi strain WA]EKX73752.1 ribosome biogenesis protein nop10, putative [Theileria equi strain WA]|eukprot:XP_004833204.1 ribosome biogenesis protein nop10, putative [Theileria equi strain WA]